MAVGEETVTVRVNISVRQPGVPYLGVGGGGAAVGPQTPLGNVGKVSPPPPVRVKPPPRPVTVMKLIEFNCGRGLKTFCFLLEKFCLMKQLGIKEKNFTVFAPTDAVHNEISNYGKLSN